MRRTIFALFVSAAISFFISACTPETYYLGKDPENMVENLTPVPVYILKGKVVEEGGGEPVENAQVFIGNTSLYSFTDNRGSYSISGIPSGNYRLVVFANNMDPYIQKITIESNISGAVIHLPFSNTINGDGNPGHRIKQLENEILILRRKKLEEKKFIIENLPVYLKGLEEFKNMIIGENRDCKILNEESLVVQNYKIGSRTNYEFSSSEPIEVLNLHLGYKLKVVLNRTVLSKGYKGYLMSNDAILCFEELNKSDYDPEVSRNWDLNRLDAFYGSQRHFLMALASRQLEEEGFDITYPPIKDVKIKNVPGDSKTFLGSTGDESYPFEHPYSIMRKGGTEDYENALYFQVELEVWYRHYYLSANEKQFENVDKYPVSRITLLHYPTIFNYNGILAIKNYLLTTGYWAVEQWYKKLPENSLPKKLF